MTVEPGLFSTGDLALPPSTEASCPGHCSLQAGSVGPLESLVWLTWGPLEVTKTKRTRELQSGN